jgi:predicted phosphoribosyltransferase
MSRDSKTGAMRADASLRSSSRIRVNLTCWCWRCPVEGVPVAYEIAEALAAPLDVFLVRRLGVPGHDELAMGAIASGGIRVLNDDVIRALRLD